MIRPFLCLVVATQSRLRLVTNPGLLFVASVRTNNITTAASTIGLLVKASR